MDILELKLSPAVLLAALRLPLTSGYAEFAAALDLFAHHLEPMTRSILQFIQSWQPAALVTDFAFPAASIAADAVKVFRFSFTTAGYPFAARASRHLPAVCPSTPPIRRRWRIMPARKPPCWRALTLALTASGCLAWQKPRRVFCAGRTRSG